MKKGSRPSLTTLGEEAEAWATRRGLGLEYNGLVMLNPISPGDLEGIRALDCFPRISSIHGPFFDLMPASADPEVRDLALRRLVNALKASLGLGLGRVVFHTGWMAKTYIDSAWLANSLAFWRELGERVPGSWEVFLENVYEEDPHLLIELLDSLGDSRIGACLDIGHVNASSPLPPQAWIKALGPRIRHVHLHNNYGKNDDHNGLLDGSLDYLPILEALEEHCPEANWNLELRNGHEASIDLVMGFLAASGYSENL